MYPEDPSYLGTVPSEGGKEHHIEVRRYDELGIGFEIHQQIDYKTFDISGHQYLLPVTSSVQSRSGSYGSRNEIQFLKYQKYSAEATIKFEDSDDATPQQPAPDQNKPDEPKKSPPKP